MKEIKTQDLKLNVFEDIKQKWVLITAFKNGKVNTMTASWGLFGNIWNFPIVMILIRQNRYTKGFVDQSDKFTVSFCENHKKELAYLGKVSGRDENKIAHVNFHVINDGDGYYYFDESSTVFKCEKVVNKKLEAEDFVDKSILKTNYSGKEIDNIHTIYFGKVVQILTK